MNKLMICGVMLALFGIAGLAMPVFTTQQTNDVARIGGLAIQTQDTISHAVPGWASASVLVLGLVLIGGGLLRGRQIS